MTSAQVCILISIAVYLIAMLAIGIVCSKRNNTVDDFYLGGRRLGPVVTAMSAEASDMSSWLLMGLPGVAYLTGVADPGWTAIGLGVGTYINWLVVARRLRRYSAHIGAITVPSFFSRRYRDEKYVLSCIAAVVILIFFIPYTASGFKAIGTLFNSLFGVNYHVAMIVGAIVVIGYTVLGGFLAVSTTDLIQSIVMTFALVFIVFFGISQAGGWESVTANATSMPGYLNLTQGYDVATNQAASFPALRIVSTLAWGLGYFGMPHILLRFMAIEDEKKLVVSRRVGSVWVVIAMFLAVMIGVVGNTLTASGTIASLSGSASETIVIQIATLLSKAGILPALMAGLILAGILASTMSTADSQLLAASSAFASDVYRPVIRKKASDSEMLWAGRIVVIVIAVVALIIASDPNSGSIMGLVENAWGVFGAAFGPVILLSLFWKRLTFGGTVAGIAAGAAVDILWLVFLSSTDIYEIVPGFAAGLLAAVVVSLLSKGPGKDVEDLFDRAVDLKS